MIERIAQHRMQSEDGRSFVVDEYQEYIDAGSKDGDDWIPGMKFLELGDGSKVNYIDENTFEIVRSGIILRRP